jgi:hypothetical protein
MQYEVVAQQVHMNVFIIRLFPMRDSQVKLFGFSEVHCG